jgi:hypothetical protein
MDFTAPTMAAGDPKQEIPFLSPHSHLVEGARSDGAMRLAILTLYAANNSN